MSEVKQLPKGALEYFCAKIASERLLANALRSEDLIPREGKLELENLFKEALDERKEK